MPPEPAESPLAGWRFTGELRTYQAEVLTRLPVGGRGPLHVVAPPGSGKTLLGLLLAARERHRTLVLAPTVTIRHQWVRTARELAPDPASVSDDPDRIADLTALTYQALSVTGDGSPFDDLARVVWAEELVEAGRSEADAGTWLAELEIDNPAQYRSGIRRRTRRLRSQFARRNPAELARVLHPNATALIDRLVDAGVRTIVLDECHHLLDHWALVVAYLAARIRETGVEPLLIGLTATLPSPDDETEFENYNGLLGEVDYEVPTPAVVKEGNLAPYRDHVLFTEPTPAEAGFIRRHEELLHSTIVDVLSTADGIAFLEEQLQPVGDDADDDTLTRVDRAFSADFALSRSCAVVLREVVPQHPLVAAIPQVLLDRCTTDDLLTVLVRFAQARLLADPAASNQWEYVRRSLADFGYLLTDRGLRRGRNPVETTLASSAAKDAAAVEILHRELASDDGERIRAVVVTDFVTHGNRRGADAAAGALRTFDALAADPVIAPLRPVLLTAQHLRVRADDAAMLAPMLADLMGAPVDIGDDLGATRDLRAAGVGTGRIVAAVSELLRRSEVRVLVGTRGLLGEGWDCPAVNTLIDLTAVATSSATQQLRGRTLRLDPEWPEKVAHNWSVACLIPADVALDDTSEPDRLRRKHSHLWGPSGDGDGRIVSGLAHAMPSDAIRELEDVLDKHPDASIRGVDDRLRAAWPARTATRSEWRIGEPYAARERDEITVRQVASAPLLRTADVARADGTTSAAGGALGVGILLAVLAGQGLVVHPLLGAALIAAGGALAAATTLLPLLGRTLRDRRHPAEVYRLAALAIARTLRDAGRIGLFDETDIVARVGADSRVRIELGGTAGDRRLVTDAVEELFSAVRTPRFLLRIDRGAAGSTRLLERLADRLSPGRTLLPVPRMIGRRRSDAELFARQWTLLIGTCTLHELQGAQGLALLRVARSSEGRLDAAQPRARVWG
ncbi:DEAD/DEAH box helicase family protein [Microbacterium sp. NPDC008134]|uniref:DEAD/DEAH box helicase family protein n=1 Tax=Microbacterium sp. NPDC008134 TaxID=3364183 RepID=UPI0036EAA19B